VAAKPKRYKGRKRNFLTLDLDYFAQDTIQDLRDEFGTAGPLVFLAILIEAKRTALAGGLPPSKQGTVTLRYRSVARMTGAAADEVRRIVAAAVANGLLTQTIDSTDDDRFTVRPAKWESWEPKDSAGAQRTRESRARQTDDFDKPFREAFG
jgi:hypothetical protein